MWYFVSLFLVSVQSIFWNVISKITCYVSSGTLDPHNNTHFYLYLWDGQPCKLPSSAAALVRPSTRPTLAHNYLWPLSKLRLVSLSQWSTKVSKVSELHILCHLTTSKEVRSLVIHLSTPPHQISTCGINWQKSENSHRFKFSSDAFAVGATAIEIWFANEVKFGCLFCQVQALMVMKLLQPSGQLLFFSAAKCLNGMLSVTD